MTCSKCGAEIAVRGCPARRIQIRPPTLHDERRRGPDGSPLAGIHDHHVPVGFFAVVVVAIVYFVAT